MTLEIFSDYVCPFCRLAEPAAFELKRIDPDVEVIRRAYELRPDPVPTLDPKAEYLGKAWARNVYPMADRLGIVMKLPPVQPRSRLAHEAAAWARTVGRFDDFHAAIFRAFFERGEDISQPGVLVSLADELGMDSRALREALDSGALTARVVDDQQLARELGVNAVPAFVADRRTALTGVQAVENLRRMLEYVRTSPPPSSKVPGGPQG
jgi:predicted DsbA family dithiol-disulfide isomerase